MSSFAPKPGCPMCSIVASSAHMIPNTPRAPTFPAGSTQPEVLWRDENFTAYREKANPVSTKGHIIVAFNLHVPSIYTLSSTDLPLLVNIRNLATRLLTNILPSSSPTLPATSSPTASTPNSQLQIGFITPPFSDRKIPVTDHLHAHAYILPADQLGWWRGIAYGPLAWYAIDDLIAEIRESVTNNRIKSGHDNRARAPIDNVPDAGARSGTANGLETTEPGLSANTDAELEGGGRTPSHLAPPENRP
ncbi:hypothetical protein MIND_00454700 [Mycena indigotica]|uniref:HIT domain-containing protein n=1 Tax=Mycena indigotica TaxID=2126181 RepID=A0A8H6W9H7_9AGAR|nr:uncharacterized protein MIND_00454700 [Mycena indigotica]KAF7306633.1 hypothetical protein MIND_00454700 [Mycena indigotica]